MQGSEYYKNQEKLLLWGKRGFWLGQGTERNLGSDMKSLSPSTSWMFLLDNQSLSLYWFYVFCILLLQWKVLKSWSECLGHHPFNPSYLCTFHFKVAFAAEQDRWVKGILICSLRNL